jgi:hypothetical protein
MLCMMPFTVLRGLPLVGAKEDLRTGGWCADMLRIA